MLNVYLDDALIHSQAIARTGFGDSLNRAIGIGTHALGDDWFQGLIYNPSVYLVPEPSTMGMLLFGLQCTNNLKQIGLALHNYHTAHSALPFGSGYAVAPDRMGT